jgi:hypothetical protein
VPYISLVQYDDIRHRQRVLLLSRFETLPFPRQ